MPIIIRSDFKSLNRYLLGYSAWICIIIVQNVHLRVRWFKRHNVQTDHVPHLTSVVILIYFFGSRPFIVVNGASIKTSK